MARKSELLLKILLWLGKVTILLGAVSALAIFLTLLLPFSGAPRLWNLRSYVAPANGYERAYLIQDQILASGVLVQIVGGIFVVGTFLYTVRTLRVTQEELHVTREGQITERFTRAIDQISSRDREGNKVIETRLGGIYALERIARDSEPDRESIMEVLTAYIRENSPWQDVGSGDADGQELTVPSRKPGVDIQAIMTVIGRRTEALGRANKAKPLNLQNTDLRSLNLNNGTFMDIDFSEANLGEADLGNSHLEGARLIGTKLQAWLVDAHLRGAVLTSACLQGADLTDADLTDADLSGAQLQSATMHRTTLKGADVSDCDLQDAILIAVDLTSVKGLTWTQLREARVDDSCVLPPLSVDVDVVA